MKLTPQEYKKQENRRLRYKLTQENYLSLYNTQKGCCAICGEFIELNSTKRHNNTVNIDHNHKTKKVRGLLCGNCNVGLGCFKDSPERLQSAIRYLHETDTSHS